MLLIISSYLLFFFSSNILSLSSSCDLDRASALFALLIAIYNCLDTFLSTEISSLSNVFFLKEFIFITHTAFQDSLIGIAI